MSDEKLTRRETLTIWAIFIILLLLMGGMEWITGVPFFWYCYSGAAA